MDRQDPRHVAQALLPLAQAARQLRQRPAGEAQVLTGRFGDMYTQLIGITKLKTNCRPLRVSTLARNFLRFLLAFTILNSIAAPSNGMIGIGIH